MAESTRDIKRRIRGVKATQQITRAMEMVAAVKLNRVRAEAENSRLFVENIKLIMQALCSTIEDVDHPLFVTREQKKIGLVVISSDRGLCGTFNVNVVNAARAFIEEKTAAGGDVSVYAVGAKASETLAKLGCTVERTIATPWGQEIEHEMGALCQHFREGYTEGHYDAVYLLYSRFENVLKHVPTVVQYLPVPPLTEQEKKELLKLSADFLVEPGFEEVANVLAPRYLETQLSHSLVESLASEFAARMVSMRNASDNADEVIDGLNLSYNKARQAAITRELIDIIGGVEAMKG